MIKLAPSVRRFGLKFALLALLALPEMAGAQYFTYNKVGDVLAGFRKTGANDTTGYEMVADLGNVTNLIKLPLGTMITITNFTPGQLTEAFANNNNLQWSAFCAFSPGGLTTPYWSTPLGKFPNYTLWLTVPDSSVTTQTTPPSTNSVDLQIATYEAIEGVGSDTVLISGDLPESEGNTNTVVIEPETAAYTDYVLGYSIEDQNNNADGDFGGAAGVPLPFDVENTTPATFTSAQRDDFYQFVPVSKTDPITGTVDATPYFVGYFLLNPNGTMTFTRAAAVTVPSAGTIAASVTNGFGPLTVVFTNTASGTITDWVWNFGNGTIITNTTGGDVTNTYAAAGDYTVTLTVYGPGGSATNVVANFIVASPTPKISLTAANGQVVFSGTNCPAGVQYRILSSSNVSTALSNWKPVYTNTFANNGNFAYTNSDAGGNAYFIMVSP